MKFFFLINSSLISLNTSKIYLLEKPPSLLEFVGTIMKVKSVFSIISLGFLQNIKFLKFLFIIFLRQVHKMDKSYFYIFLQVFDFCLKQIL